MNWLYAYIGSIIGAFLTIVVITVMRREERHNLGRLTWLLLVLLSPPVGFVLFLLLGGRKISAEHASRELVQMPDCEETDTEPRCSIESLMLARGLHKPTVSNEIKLLDTPEKAREALFELIERAEKTLYVMTFMFLDEVADEVMDRLCQRAREGVQVRLLVDGFGSFLTDQSQLDRLIEAGGRAEKFKRFSRLSKLAYLNFRNHRKLAVADGKIALLGGANIVDKEIPSIVTEETWIDLSLWVEGPAATQMQSVFCSDWNFITDEELPPPEVERCEPGHGSSECARLTVMPIGPDGPAEILEDFWLLGIQQAVERVWICTPYFVPPPSAMRSLELACRRGLDVRIVVPDDSDVGPADHARYDYLEELIEVGATVLRYPDRMVHAKVGLIDDQVAIVGSANFDLRSFFLNYELSVLLHDACSVGQVEKWLEQLMEPCRSGIEKRSAMRGVMSTISRMFASEL